MKRLFDVTISLLGLILLSPAFILLAIVVKLSDGGPVIFRQERIGRGFRPFTLYKFRSMVVDASERGPAITAAGDPRVTPLGRILRHTKVDELLQLYNVLKGDMSFVGPRPEVRQYVDLFRAEYEEILAVRPGITDLASITYRDESPLLEKAKDPEKQYRHVILPEKLRLAKEYVRRASVFYDLELILTTVFSLLYPDRTLDRFLDSLAPHRYPIAAAVQSLLLILANYLAFSLRFGGQIPAGEYDLFLASIPALLAIRLICFYPFRLYRGLWRYVGIQDLQSIASSITLSSAVWWILTRLVPPLYSYPRSVIVLDWILSLTLLVGVRLLRRLHGEFVSEAFESRSALIVGSGDSAERVVTGLRATQHVHYRVVGLIDNAPHHKGASIHNVPVLGSLENLETVIRAEDPDEIFVAISSTPEVDRSKVLGACKRLGKPIKWVPDLKDILSGGDWPRLLRGSNPDDLLFREPIHADLEPIRHFYSNKRVLITGAGGSIGSEIARQVANCMPNTIVLFEKHEASLYMIDRELRERRPDLAIDTIIGDITDEIRVEEIFQRTSPQIVFHAAAYKHVPMMERNAVEAFKTNVCGTKIVSSLAGERGVETFVLISTDKAVDPLSVMGISKRAAELSLRGVSGRNRTKYTTVRFGNVLESSGSVIPLFREQIERGGPVTVTHPEVTRLFMTIPEAVALILHACAMGSGGEVFILDLGKPIRILDLAKALIRLYGLIPGRDIEIVFTGLRPGERLSEKLVNDFERVCNTSHPMIFMAVTEGSESKSREEILRRIAAIEKAAGEGRSHPVFESVRQILS